MATDNNSSVLRAIFSRTFVAISLINMLGMVGYYAIFVICTHFAAEQFGASLAMAGLATGIVVIGCLVGRFFYGLHHSHCRLSTSALYRCCGHVFNERSLLDCRRSLATLYCSFHLRLAKGVIGTATGTFVATIVPRHLHGRGIAYYSMSTALALCFGPFIGIALLGTIDYTGIFTFLPVLCRCNVGDSTDFRAFI